MKKKKPFLFFLFRQKFSTEVEKPKVKSYDVMKWRNLTLRFVMKKLSFDPFFFLILRQREMESKKKKGLAFVSTEIEQK